MSSNNMYENLPLRKMRDESSQNFTEINQKKRKSTPEIERVSSQNAIPKKTKSSKSISEMFFNEVDDNISGQDSGSAETLKSIGEENGKKGTTVQSTPGSTLDDGYESYNSTPLVSGIILPPLPIYDATFFANYLTTIFRFESTPTR